MKLHGNARLSVKGRELLVERILRAGWSLAAAGEAAGVSDRTARKCCPATGPKVPRGCWTAPQPRWSWPIAPTSAGSR